MHNRFWSNVASVVSGSTVAQAIPIIGSIALARVYAPEAFGSYSIWVGLVLILAVIATLRLEMALAVVDEGDNRLEAVHLVAVTAVFVGIVMGSCIAALWFYKLVLSSFHTPLLILALIFAAIMTAISDTWQSWAAADGAYPTLIHIRIAQAAAIFATQFGGAFISSTPETLILGHMTGLVIALCIAYWRLPMPLPSIQGLPRRLRSFWSAQSRFPLLALPADAISAICSQLPIFIVSSRFGTESAGILALTIRVLGAPIALLGRAVLDVFRRYAADAYRRKGNCRSEYISIFRVLLFCSVLFVICTFLFAEPIFRLAFGPQWAMSGLLAIWLAPLFALRFIASPLSYVFYIAGKQNIDLLWQIGLLIVLLCALWLPNSMNSAVIAYSYAYSVMYLIYLGLSYRSSKGIK
jgi:O-antigen/teichoic acid export membrane protein